jgi:hypothetical protein
MIGPSQGLYLNTGNYKHIKHQCSKWDSNPRSERPSERRQFMPSTVWLMWPAYSFYLYIYIVCLLCSPFVHLHFTLLTLFLCTNPALQELRRHRGGTLGRAVLFAVEPWVDSWPDCDVHQALACFSSTLCSSSQWRRGSNVLIAAKCAANNMKAGPYFLVVKL